MANKRNIPAVDVAALGQLAEELPSAQSEATKKAKGTIKPIESEDSPLTVKIPDYVHRDLKIQAATTGKTQRQILLEALKMWGVDVKEDDIIDRRKA